MANISVVELLSDPDFVDPVTVLRQNVTVGNDGLAVTTVQTINIMASIQAASGDDLALHPDYARTEGTYEVITTFPLAAATETTAADIVLWRGMEHTVISIGRFGNFANGAGHYEGVMAIKPTTTTVGPP